MILVERWFRNQVGFRARGLFVEFGIGMILNLAAGVASRLQPSDRRATAVASPIRRMVARRKLPPAMFEIVSLLGWLLI